MTTINATLEDYQEMTGLQFLALNELVEEAASMPIGIDEHDALQRVSDEELLEALIDTTMDFDWSDPKIAEILGAAVTEIQRATLNAVLEKIHTGEIDPE